LEQAKTDEAFEWIRDDEEFKKIVGSSE